jgi:hypothetical protein
MSSSHDRSGSNDSVFDWGLSSLVSISPLTPKPVISLINRAVAPPLPSSMEENDDGPSSRYDPKAMSRIVDITDLVDESLGGDDSDGYDSVDEDVAAACEREPSNMSLDASSPTIQSNQNPNKRRLQYGPGGMGCRQAIVLISLVGMILAATLAIGYAVLINNGGNNNNNNNNASFPSNNNRGSVNSVRGNTNEQQLLLEMAERITIACSEEMLERYGVYRSECRMLCHDSLCCFEESAEDNCEDDESKACAVYAGCQALVL